MFSYQTFFDILSNLILNFQKVPLQAHAYICRNENNKKIYNTNTCDIVADNIIVGHHNMCDRHICDKHICRNKNMGGKRIYKTILACNNNGSATIEASLVIPVFLMAVLALYTMGSLLITKNIIYEGFQETAQYMAEYEYIYENQAFIEEDNGTKLLNDAIGTVSVWNKLKEFIDDEDMVSQYVDSGMAGIWCTYAYYDSDDGYVYMEISYKLKSDILFMGLFSTRIFEQIKQKAYTGMFDSDSVERDVYVYVAENASVYHKSRSCYHIKLSVVSIDRKLLESDYGYLTPCEYCAKNKSCDGNIYITDNGSRYHYRLGCSGLKRTVYRVKLSDVNNLPPCSACGGA